MESKTVVFALTLNVELANEIMGELGIPSGQCDVKHSSDREIMVGLGEFACGKSVYIVQFMCAPVSSDIMKVLIATDAYKRASAGHISAVMPYSGRVRQGCKAGPRQPVTSKLVVDLLERTGVDRAITMELYATQIQGLFNIPADDTPAIRIIGQYFKNLNLKNAVAISPDHDGTTRARRPAEILRASLAIIDKRCLKPDVVEAMNIIGDVNGETAIVADDTVDAAGTPTAGIQMLYDRGATVVCASCVHGALFGSTIDRLRVVSLEEFTRINTILQDDKAALYPQMKVLSVEFVLGQAIKTVEESGPVGGIVTKYAE